MNSLLLAKKYMEVFYKTGDFESLYEIFDNQLEFVGPLFHFNCAKDYIESLIDSPPVGCQYAILEEYESENSACLIYEFSKNGRKTIMSQSFSVADNRINKIRLVFNVADIT